MKKLITAIFILYSFNSFAQFPIDLPGGLQIEFGFNQFTNAPYIEGTTEEVPLKFFGSKGTNIYYMYEIRLGHDQFTFHPGFGVGIQNYSFDGNYRVSKHNGGLNDSDPLFGSLIFYEDNSREWEKSKLSATYLDIPLEFRFRSNTGRKAFRAGIGGKIGYLVSSHSKRKAKDFAGDTSREKFKTDFRMKKLRYGLTARVGFGNIDFFTYYNLSEVFESDKLYSNVINNENRKPGMIMFGITLHGL